MFQLKGAEGIALLDAWLKWAWRCRLPAFVQLARSIREHRAGINVALTHGLSNERASHCAFYRGSDADAGLVGLLVA